MNEMANIDTQIVFRVYKSILSENFVGENEITAARFPFTGTRSRCLFSMCRAAFKSNLNADWLLLLNWIWLKSIADEFLIHVALWVRVIRAIRLRILWSAFDGSEEYANDGKRHRRY